MLFPCQLYPGGNERDRILRVGWRFPVLPYVNEIVLMHTCYYKSNENHTPIHVGETLPQNHNTILLISYYLHRPITLSHAKELFHAPGMKYMPNLITGQPGTHRDANLFMHEHGTTLSQRWYIKGGTHTF